MVVISVVDSVCIIISMVMCVSQALLDFKDNKVTEMDGDGQAFFAEDIRSCIIPQLVNSSNTDYEKSVFSVDTIFKLT